MKPLYAKITENHLLDSIRIICYESLTNLSYKEWLKGKIEPNETPEEHLVSLEATIYEELN